MDNKVSVNEAKARFYKFISFKNKFALFLSCIIFVCYYAFVASVGFFPDVLGYRIGPSSITLGILCGISLIVLCIIVTGIYTFFANKYLDKEQSEILKELEESGAIEDLKEGK